MASLLVHTFGGGLRQAPTLLPAVLLGPRPALQRLWNRSAHSQADPSPLTAAWRPARTATCSRPSTNTGQQRRDSLRAPTRDLDYDSDRWQRHRSPWRHLRHLALLPCSAALSRLAFPDLAVLAVSSTGIVAYNSVLVDQEHEIAVWLSQGSALTMPLLPLTLPAVALGLLVTFRVNASYDRFLLARQHWGQLINTTRNLARQLIVWLPDPSSSVRADAVKPSVQVLARTCMQMLKAFPLALRYHVTTDWRGSQPMDMQFREELIQVFAASSSTRDSEEDGRARASMGDLDSAARAEVEWLLGAANRPQHIVHRLSYLVLLWSRSPKERCADSQQMIREIEGEIQDLTDLLGGCERIMRTPIPTSYTRHTSRFLTVWCHCLPMALYPVCGALGTVPATLFVAYVLLGIEDIAVQIEEPFDILPLWQYVNTVQLSVDRTIDASMLPPPQAGLSTHDQSSKLC